MLGDPVRLIVRAEYIGRVSSENRLMCGEKCTYLAQLNGRSLCSLGNAVTAVDGMLRHGGCFKAEELAATEPQG